MRDRIARFRPKTDAACPAGKRGAVAGIMADAERCERAQRIVIGAVVPGAEGNRGRRTRCHQGGAGIVEDRALLLEREVGELVPRAPRSQRIVAARQREPFGVAMQLHVLSSIEDGADDILDCGHAPHQRGHGIDEKHRLLAVACQQFELVGDARRALRGVAGDRAGEVVGPVSRTRPGVESRGILGVDRDEHAGHAAPALAAKG